MRTAEQTAANTAYAARRRREQWIAKAESRTTCPAVLGNRVKCGWPLENRLVNGVTEPFCPQCDRKRRGICLDCKSERVDGTPGKALRCRHCAKLEHVAAENRWRKKHPGKVRQQWRRRREKMRADGSYAAKVLERKKLWRLAMPTRVREHKKKWNSSEHARQYQRDYRARMAEERRTRERERCRMRARGLTMTHPCTSCGVELTGRPKKCETCRRRDFRAARAILTGAAA